MFERLLMKIRGKNSDADLRWCIDHGFRHGDNFNCFTPDAIDSNYPWLITVGDNVTISSDVKILAHDASTLLTKSHTKVGIVNIGDNVFHWCWDNCPVQYKDRRQCCDWSELCCYT